MRTQIRKSVFETNSSSTHSIVIANNYNDSSVPKVIKFHMGDYGWECERYDTLQDRANYLFTAIICNSNSEQLIEKLKETLYTHGIEAVFPETHIVKTDWKGNPFENEKDWYLECVNEGGYIDHCEELSYFLSMIFDDEVLLMNYLFNGDSFIVTGNDNDDEELDDSIDESKCLAKFYKGN